MNYIKVGKDKYFSAFVRDFNKYKLMLKSILIDNRNVDKLMFMGCIDEGKNTGILISGDDINSVSEITKFFPIDTIKELFDKNIKDKRFRQ